MTYDDDDYAYEDYDGERLHRHAVRMLVQKHRDEYDELAGGFQEKRVEELEARLVETQKALEDARGRNPNGTAVSAIEETANLLARENDELRREVTKKHRELAKTKQELAAITQAIQKVKVKS